MFSCTATNLPVFHSFMWSFSKTFHLISNFSHILFLTPWENLSQFPALFLAELFMKTMHLIRENRWEIRISLENLLTPQAAHFIIPAVHLPVGIITTWLISLSLVTLVFLTANGKWERCSLGVCVDICFHSVSCYLFWQCPSSEHNVLSCLCAQGIEPNALCCLPVKRLYIHDFFCFILSLHCSFCPPFVWTLSWSLGFTARSCDDGLAGQCYATLRLLHGTNWVRQAERTVHRPGLKITLL